MVARSFALNKRQKQDDIILNQPSLEVSPLRKILLLCLLITVSALILAACTGSSADEPAKTVEAYWQALAAQDSAQVSSLSCATYETEALNTLESFKSVAVTLNDLTCSSTSTTDTSASISCKGTFVASYGTEKLTLNLADRTYAAVKEGGEWRMCGAEQK